MNISILEFGVYGFIAYSSLLMLIISASKDTPMVKTKSGALVKSMYMIPGIICCIILAGSGVTIFLDGSVTTTTNNSTYQVLDNTNAIVSLNSNVTETVAKSPAYFTLQNPIWVLMHYMFALILAAYVFTQVLKMLTAID